MRARDERIDREVLRAHPIEGRERAAKHVIARTDRLRALEAGFSAHISKPVEPSELIATVAAVVGPSAPLVHRAGGRNGVR